MADPIIKFSGDPVLNFHHGIPARDLSQADYDALDNDQRAIVRASAVYDYAAYKVKDAPAPVKDASK